jgi:hypothetical protein
LRKYVHCEIIFGFDNNLWQSICLKLWVWQLWKVMWIWVLRQNCLPLFLVENTHAKTSLTFHFSNSIYWKFHWHLFYIFFLVVMTKNAKISFFTQFNGNTFLFQWFLFFKHFRSRTLLKMICFASFLLFLD